MALTLLVFLCITGFIVLGVQNAGAALKLKLVSSIGTTVTVVDNGPEDTNPAVGGIGYNTPIDDFTFVDVTGFSNRGIPGASDARLLLRGVTVGPGTLIISLTDTDFGPSSAPDVLTSEIGGTTDGTTTFQSYLDPANAEFGMDCTTGSQGPFGPGGFDSTVATECTPAGLFSLTQVAEVKLQALSDVQSFNAVTSIPVPPPLCSIGDFVWEDADRDGCQGDEEGIEGVEVRLFDGCFGDVIATTVTDATGFYKFDGLECEKDYGIQFVDNPDDIYEQTQADQMCVPGDTEASDKKDSDCGDEGKVCVPASTLPPGTFNDTIDCGYVCVGEIGDFVWLDANGTPGCQDPDEPVILDVTANLFKVDGCPDVQGLTPFMTTTTDNQGKYLFEGLCPGDYRVTFDDPENRENTIVDQSCENFPPGPPPDTTDSDCGGPDECVTLTVGNPVDETIDCGKIPPPGCELDLVKECRVETPPDGDVCEVLGKPVALTFRYNPGTTADTAYDSGKAEVLFDSGIVDDDGVSFVIVTDESDAAKALGGDGKRFFQGNVAFNALFEANEATDDFGSQTYIHFFDDAAGGLLQSITYHTSCSQPIQLGDVIGNATLVAYAGESGSTGNGTPVTYIYTVMGMGDQDISNVAVVDDLLGPIPGPSSGDDGDGILEPGEKWIYEAVTTVAEDTTNTATVTGTFAGTERACEEDQDSSTVIFVEPTCEVSIQLDKIESKKIKWKLSNPSIIPATIETLTITWPGDIKLKKVRYDGTEILKDAFLPPPTTTILSGDWLKEPKDRTVNPGDTGKTLEIEFDADFPLGSNQPQGDFTLKVTFEQGCEVSF